MIFFYFFFLPKKAWSVFFFFLIWMYPWYLPSLFYVAYFLFPQKTIYYHKVLHFFPVWNQTYSWSDSVSNYRYIFSNSYSPGSTRSSVFLFTFRLKMKVTFGFDQALNDALANLKSVFIFRPGCSYNSYGVLFGQTFSGGL